MAGSQFYIQVYQGLLDPKHCKAMDRAVWVYLWCLDHQTSKDGKVLGGESIPAKRIAAELEYPVKTIRNWLYRLAGKYLHIEADFKGYRITILKPKRVFKGYAPHGAECPSEGIPPTGHTTPTREGALPSGGQESTLGRAHPYKEYKTVKQELDNKAVAQAILEKWNSKKTLPKIRTMTSGRLAKLKARLKEPDFSEHWSEGIDALACSPHHIGENDRGWQADIDWFLKNDSNWLKVWEKWKSRQKPSPDPKVEAVKEDLERAREDAIPPTPEFLKILEKLGGKKTIDEALAKPARQFIPISQGATDKGIAQIRSLLKDAGLEPHWDPRRYGFEISDLEQARHILENFVFKQEGHNEPIS